MPTYYQTADERQLAEHDSSDRFCIFNDCEAKFQAQMKAHEAEKSLAVKPAYNHLVVSYKTPANDGICLYPSLLTIAQEDELLDLMVEFDEVAA